MGGFGYVREDHNTAFLGERRDDHVWISPQWRADIGTIAEDPDASFLFVDNRHRKAVSDAVRRGLGLPVRRKVDTVIKVEAERCLAADFARASDGSGRYS